MYKGTDNYLPANAKGFSAVNWGKQLKSIFHVFSDTTLAEISSANCDDSTWFCHGFTDIIAMTNAMNKKKVAFAASPTQITEYVAEKGSKFWKTPKKGKLRDEIYRRRPKGKSEDITAELRAYHMAVASLRLWRGRV